MSMSSSTLPCEGEIPERYVKSQQLKMWYCDGFQDGMNNVPMQNNESVRRHQGDRAWEAYCLGYEAGVKRRILEQGA
jgi:hypothetical protein